LEGKTLVLIVKVVSIAMVVPLIITWVLILITDDRFLFFGGALSLRVSLVALGWFGAWFIAIMICFVGLQRRTALQFYCPKCGDYALGLRTRPRCATCGTIRYPVRYCPNCQTAEPMIETTGIARIAGQR